MKSQAATVDISLVVPVFNEQEVVEECARRLQNTMEQLGVLYEILFINDGSSDQTAPIICDLCRKDRRIKLINFSRNFGHQIAISAGMDHARGKAVVIIDSDLQDPPEVIPLLVQKWQEGYEVVYGKRKKRRGEGLLKKWSAALFYRFLKIMTDIQIPADVGDFRLIDRKVCEVMKTLREKNRFIRGLICWTGFKQTSVEYIRDERFAGKTKYPLKKMLQFAVDAVTSFSSKPLKLAMFLGFLSSVFGFGYLLYTLYQACITKKVVPGWTSIIILLIFFNGIILFVLGLIGTYVGRIYEELKNRPLYIVESTENFSRPDDGVQ